MHILNSTMVLWFLVILFFSYFFYRFVFVFIKSFYELSFQREKASFLEALSKIKKIKWTLESGVLPSEAMWLDLKKIKKPLSDFIYLSVSELRKNGCALVPTLNRYEEFITFQLDMIHLSELKSSQALGQSIVFLVIIPVLSVLFYFFMPWLHDYVFEWLFLSFFSFSICFLGFIWIYILCEKSIYGGAHVSQRSYSTDVQIFIELLFAKINSGSSADQAWGECLEFFKNLQMDFIHLLNHSAKKPQSSVSSLVKTLLLSTRSSIYYHLMEGKPCSDIISFHIKNFRTDYSSILMKKMETLPMQTLKPLFICGAPSILLLILGVFYFTWESLRYDVF